MKESLQFDENKWSNNVAKLKEFFDIVNQNPEGPFKALKRDYRNILKSLRGCGLFDDSTELPPINLDNQNSMDQSSDMYSSDNSNYNVNLGATMQTID